MINYLKKFVLASSFVAIATGSSAGDYPSPVPLMDGAQAPMSSISPKNEKYRIAYMPPATEFNYYIAIGEGIKACLLYTSPSPRDMRRSRMPSSA